MLYYRKKIDMPDIWLYTQRIYIVVASLTPAFLQRTGNVSVDMTSEKLSIYCPHDSHDHFKTSNQ